MSLECVVSVEQRRKLTANGLKNLSKRFHMSGKLFWKQPLRGAEENGALKIYAKYLKNICEVAFHNSFYKKLKII